MSDTTLAPEQVKKAKEAKKSESTQPPTVSQPPAPAPVPALETTKRDWKRKDIGQRRGHGKRPGDEPITSGEVEKDEDEKPKMGLGKVKNKSFAKNRTDAPEEQEGEGHGEPGELGGYEELGEDDWEHQNTRVNTVETEDVESENGLGTVGQKTTKTRERTKGRARSREKETTGGTSGGARVTKKVSREELIGAQAKLEQTLVKYDNGDVQATLDAIARAGAFGEAAAEGAIKKGPYEAWIKGKAEGGVGIQTSMKGEANIQKNGRFRYEIALALEAAAKVGLWGEASGEVGGKIGPLSAKLYGEISAWAGAQASFKAEAFASKAKGIGAELEAKAAAGAGAEGKAGASLDLGPMGFDVEVFGEAFAGAEANFSAGFHVSLNNISAKFEASAFAGARASAGAKGGIRIRGREILSVKGEVSVMAGVGGKAKGSFKASGGLTLRDGKPSLSNGIDENEKGSEHVVGGEWKDDKGDDDEVTAPFELKRDGKIEFGGALSGALGLGAGVEVEGGFDYGSLAELITAELYEMSRSSADKKYDAKGAQFKRDDLPKDSPMAKRMRTRGYNAMFSSLQAYDTQKNAEGNHKHGVKEGKIRGIIMDNLLGNTQYTAYKEFDRGIEDAVYAAFKGQVKKVVVDGGAVEELVMIDPESQEAKDYRAAIAEEQGWATARDSLINAFVDYASEAEKGDAKKGGAKKAKVQEIIEKHRKPIETAFAKKGPGAPKKGSKPLVTDMTATVGQVVDHAAQQSGITRYFRRWEVGASGRISSDTVEDPAATGKIQAAYQQGQKINGVIGKLYDAKGKLDALVSSKLANEQATFISRYEINSILNEVLGDVDTSIKSDHEYNTRLRQIVVEALKGRPNAEVKDYLFDSTNFEVKGGQLTKYAANGDALTRLRAQKKKDADDGKKKRVFNAIKSDVAIYKEKKIQLKNAENGVKVDKINGIILERVKDLAKLPGITMQSISGDIKAAVEEGLGIEPKEGDPTSGVVMSEQFGLVMTLPAAWVTEHLKEKSETKENGRATLRDKGGQLNNTRRQMVHGTMRVPLDEIRAGFDQRMLGEYGIEIMDPEEAKELFAPTAEALINALQGVVNKARNKNKADVSNAVGRSAMAEEITSRFSDVLENVAIDENFKLTADEVSNWRQQVEQNLSANKDSKRAVTYLHDEIAGLWMIGSRKTRVQEILDEVYANLPGKTLREKDELAKKLIKKALPRVTFGQFTLIGGRVVDWVVIGS